MQEPLSQLSHRVSPGRLLGLTVLDITKFFGLTTGGIRTYLLEKAKFVRQHETLRQVVVVPAKDSSVVTEGNTRWYRIAGPPIPTQAPYRVKVRLPPARGWRPWLVRPWARHR